MIHTVRGAGYVLKPAECASDAERRTAAPAAPGRWTLRVAARRRVLALLAVVCLVVGVVTTLALRAFLVEPARRAGRRRRPAAPSRPLQPATDDDRPGAGGRQPRTTRGLPQAPGQAVGTIGAHVVERHGHAAGVLAPAAAPRRRPDRRRSGAVARGASRPTARAADQRRSTASGTYRLLATPDDRRRRHRHRPAAGRRRATRSPGSSLRRGAASPAAALVVAGGRRRGARAPLARARCERVAATARRVSRAAAGRGRGRACAERVPEPTPTRAPRSARSALALNRMLGHVGGALAARHASETRVRQFVADASHELRTPLAAIRGYAELPAARRDRCPPTPRTPSMRVASQTERMTDARRRPAAAGPPRRRPAAGARRRST